MKKSLSCVALLSLLLLGSPLRAENVALSWDANTEADLAGYKIHYGTASRNYTAVVDVGRVTTCTVPNLAAGQTYYFAATAYNASGASSGYSSEVSHTVPIPNASPTTPTVSSGPASGWTNVAYGFTAAATDPNGDTLQYRFDWGDGSLSGWGAAGQSHSWSAAGQYAVKAQAMDSRGAMSAWSAARAVAIGANAAPTANAGADQGVASGAAVVLDGGRSSDPDDGIAAYQWRQVSGPSVQIANAQSRQADFTSPNVPSGSLTLHFELRVSDTLGNTASDTCAVTVSAAPAPATPVNPVGSNGGGAASPEPLGAGEARPQPPALVAPRDDETVTLAPELKTGAFRYAGGPAGHAGTRWQVFREDDNLCVLDIESRSALTALRLPKLVLEEETAYFWRAMFLAGDGKASEWSDYGYFTTGATGADLNANGVPDAREAAYRVDLDQNGIDDNRQPTIRTVAVEGASLLVGVSIRKSPNAVAIEAVEPEAAEPGALTIGGQAAETHFGLIHFRVAVARPGDATNVKIHFSEPAPRKAKWFKYDPIAGAWSDFSDNARFTFNRRFVVLTLQDGGVGDADGVANGVIVDPSALVVFEKNRRR